jgi:hypothetical protein
MAQETVIHRADAELAAGAPVAVIPGDLAADGIDELLGRLRAVRHGHPAAEVRRAARGRGRACGQRGHAAAVVAAEPDHQRRAGRRARYGYSGRFGAQTPGRLPVVDETRFKRVR